MSNVGLAVFVLVPLFAFSMLPVLRLVQNTSYIVRRKSREAHLYALLLFTVAKAAVFALVVSASGLGVLLAKLPVGADVGGVLSVAGLSALLQLCFFSVCGTLLLAVFVGAGKVQAAVVVLLCYAIWDFLTDHIPLYAGELPFVGWHLTEVSYPIEPFGFLRGLLTLAALFMFLLCLSLLFVRRRDLVQERRLDRDA